MYEKTLSAVSEYRCPGGSERRTEKQDLKNIIYLSSAAIFPNGKISKKIVLPVEKRLDGKTAFERFDGGREGKPASVSPLHTHSLFCLPFPYIF